MTDYSPWAVTSAASTEALTGRNRGIFGDRLALLRAARLVAAVAVAKPPGSWWSTD